MRTGKILKVFFEKREVKQKEIAEAIGVSEGAISQALSNIVIPKQERVEKIIKYLKLSKEEELEVWKAWTLDRGEEKAVAYFEKVDKENKKLKKILASIKEL